MTTTYLGRRLLLGVIIGLAISALLMVLVERASLDNGLTLADLNGRTRLLITGGLLGLACAAFFRPVAGPVDDLIRGAILGLLAWAVLALNVYPVLMGQGPMWQVAAVAPFFPQLIAYLLMGGTTGLVYNRVYTLLARPLRLAEPAVVIPEIKTRIVILGGGYAGVSAAQSLEEEFKHDPSEGIWLVSSTNYLLHTPMLSEVAASTVNAHHISPPLRDFFHSVQVVQGTVAHIDCAAHTVYLASDGRSPPRQLPFDHLILAAGSQPHFFGTKGVAEHAFTFKALEDAVLIRNRVIDMFERADFEPDPAQRRQLLTFVVAGGGFAGVELIGALNDFARGIAPYYPNVALEEIRLILVHSRETILPELSAGLGNYAQEKLTQRGVEFKLGAHVTGAESGAVLLADQKIPTETFIWTAGNQPNPVLTTLGLPLTERGQIAVDMNLAVPTTPGLWAVGDCAQVPDVTTGGFAPPTAQHALREGKVVGQNVAAHIQGKPLTPFHYKHIGSLAALGHQLAVAEVFGYRFSGFLAWFMWRSIYLSKLPTLARQVRVGLDWALDLFFPPDIVQTIDFSRIELPEVESEMKGQVSAVDDKVAQRVPR